MATTIKDLKPGCYQLSRNISNPKVDRRCTNDWTRLPFFPTSYIFEVKEEEIPDTDVKIKSLTKRGSYRRLPREVEELIAPYLCLINDSLDTVLECTNTWDESYSILDALIRMGKISLEDVKEAKDWVNDED